MSNNARRSIRHHSKIPARPSQDHALLNSYCDVTKEQQKTPAYDLAITHKKELIAIFWRLWKFKDDQPQRDQHLDLSIAELKELRETLQTIK